MKEVREAADIEGLRVAGVREGLVRLLAATLWEIQLAFEELGAEFDPDSDGYVVLLEPGDDIENLPDVGLHPRHRGLIGIPKEGATRHEEAGAWSTVACPSNSWAWTYVMPDEVPAPTDLISELKELARTLS